MPYRAMRVERLGLAVVPQVVYPILLSIREWLEEQDAEKAGEGAHAQDIERIQETVKA